MKQTVPTSLAPPELLALVAASTHAELLLSPTMDVLAASDAYLKAVNLTRRDLVGSNLQHAFAGSSGLPRLRASVETASHMRHSHRTGGEGILVAMADGRRSEEHTSE